MLRNAVGDERLSDFRETSVTKLHGSTLLALRGGGCQISGKKPFVTLEWPQNRPNKKSWTPKIRLEKNETELANPD